MPAGPSASTCPGIARSRAGHRRAPRRREPAARGLEHVVIEDSSLVEADATEATLRAVAFAGATSRARLGEGQVEGVLDLRGRASTALRGAAALRKVRIGTDQAALRGERLRRDRGRDRRLTSIGPGSDAPASLRRHAHVLALPAHAPRRPRRRRVDSHKLLVRAGCIRRVSSGIYSWLPLGDRVLRNVAQIVREEMDPAGTQEVTFPILQPIELWEQSGRNAAYGPMMFRVKDHRENRSALAPTAEEVVTTLVAGEYSSYRDLPVNLYQINWKYPDALGPGSAYSRARVPDEGAYSFDADLDGLQRSYDAMFDVLREGLHTVGRAFRAVKAQSGEIGGDTSQEFMAVAAVAEDAFVWCEACGHAANTEAATRPGRRSRRYRTCRHATVARRHAGHQPGRRPPRDHRRPADEGDRVQRRRRSWCSRSSPAIARSTTSRSRRPPPPKNSAALDRRRLRHARRAPKGYIGPDSPARADDRGLVDPGAAQLGHRRERGRPPRPPHEVLGRGFAPGDWGESSWSNPATHADCGEPLRMDRGIEVGHVLQLGDKYSKALGAVYTDDGGAEHHMVMGCHGISVSRLVAAIAEADAAEHGLAWPAAVTPYRCTWSRCRGGVTPPRPSCRGHEALRGCGRRAWTSCSTTGTPARV